MSDNNQGSAAAPPPPPPPPPPPGGGEFSDPFANPDPIGDAGQSMDSGAPAVAAAPSRILLVFGLMLAFVIYMVFNLFVFSDDDDEFVPDDSVDIVSADAVPDIPDIGADIAPPPPPTFIPPEIPTADVPVIEPRDDGPTNELRRQRIRSSMLISGGGAGLLPDVFGGENEEEAFGEDGNLAFAAAVRRSNTKARKVKATHIGDLRRVVAEGKLIHGVLETAINTDLPGNIRAIVSRDIFPEAGRHAIIPKGSRLIGRYNSSILGGQKRVYVIWTRVIRPDGVDVMLNSPLVDGIGQAGVAGQVDTKFSEIFSRAILTSVVTISVAAIADEVNGDDVSTTTNTDGSTTTNGNATNQATIDASERVGSIAEAYLRRFINVQPTILVDQGTPVNVFVNRDLIFPSEFAGTRIIP